MRILNGLIDYATIPLLVLAQSLPLPEGSNGIAMEAMRTLGVLVVLAWYMWYTTSVSIPRILETAAKERESMALTHKAERDQNRTDFITAMADQRKEFHAALASAIEKVTCKFEQRDLPCSRNPSTS